MHLHRLPHSERVSPLFPCLVAVEGSFLPASTLPAPIAADGLSDEREVPEWRLLIGQLLEGGLLRSCNLRWKVAHRAFWAGRRGERERERESEREREYVREMEREGERESEWECEMDRGRVRKREMARDRGKDGRW